MTQTFHSRLRTALSLGAIATLAMGYSQAVLAASSWNATLLVNTESFQTIDEGDGTSNIIIRFGQTLNEQLLFNRTTNRFEFTKGISAQGTISGSSLNVDRNATVGGRLTASGSIRTLGNFTGSSLTIDRNANIAGIISASGAIKTRGGFTGSTLRISGPADIHGALSASGSIRTDDNVTINDDRTAATDAVLTFGNETTNQTLKYIHSLQKFQFSKDISVIGNISGSTLNVDGNVTIKNVTYNFTNTQGGANTFLKNDGAGNLTWSAAASVGNGSGGIMSLHPRYPDAVYFASGSTIIGQLSDTYDATNGQNYYRWTSSKSSLQDYWIAIRARLPDNFSSWDPVKPIEFRYRTGVASNANNYLNVKMLDTTGAAVTLTNGSLLANTSWTTANITGPESAGTYTPKSFVTIFIKFATLTTGGAFADASHINLNFETTTP